VKQELPVVRFRSQQEWIDWLEENHASSGGVRLKLAKKDSGIESVTQREAVEAALCFGWIDGQAESVDGDFWIQRFTRRRPKSKWSKINCDRALALVEQRKMRPAGQAEIDAARRDGRWDAAYASPRNMTVPEDFQRKLSENPLALKFFNELDSRNRYAILYRIHDAKKPETRARRIEKFIALLNEGQTLY
jgi:uncharacterized protein YdeI (YjbR/CyaY-like superfamily)